jgi:hypothetical protein
MTGLRRIYSRDLFGYYHYPLELEDYLHPIHMGN